MTHYELAYELLLFLVGEHSFKSILRLNSSPMPENSDQFLKVIKKKIRDQEKIEPNDLMITECKLLRFTFRTLTHQSRETLVLKKTAVRELNLTPGKDLLPDVVSDDDSMMWMRERSWSYIQAALLSVGLIPNSLIEYDFGTTERIMVFYDNSLITEVDYRYELIKKHSYDYGLKNASPLEFLRWFKSMELSTPDNLMRAAKLLNRARNEFGELIEESASEGDLKVLERQTLFKLITAMSIRGYAFDPNAKRNQSTADIQSDLDFLGIGLDQKTILKWLKKAASVLPSDSD